MAAADDPAADPPSTRQGAVQVLLLACMPLKAGAAVLYRLRVVHDMGAAVVLFGLVLFDADAACVWGENS
jgi:hypothetical protein